MYKIPTNLDFDKFFTEEFDKRFQNYSISERTLEEVFMDINKPDSSQNSETEVNFERKS